MISEAVKDAERATGLQFCVYLGPTEVDARAHAEALFRHSGLHNRPSVLILVAPQHRRVEVVTGPLARARVDDGASTHAVDAMTEHFGRGRLVEGIVAGLQELAAAAGAGIDPADGGEQLPNVLDDE
jgi:uncharacterized membrane protein